MTTRSIDWVDGVVVAVDQRALPEVYRTVRLTTVDEVVESIRTLTIRGAPAIGAAAALGVALSARRHLPGPVQGAGEAAVRSDAERLASARPTAVNLRWAIERVLLALPQGGDAVVNEALAVLAEDEAINRAAARHAAEHVLELCGRRRLRLLTHCNTGRLATVAWGTALGAIRELADMGYIQEVLAGETRPLLQGARLTTWELAEAGIPHRLCVDAAGPAAIAAGMVDCVIVGADRVTANGDVANKVGTYALAVAAARHRVPFVVVAPESTLDSALATGDHVVIEERAADEVTGYAGRPVAPPGTAAYNPAFDVTPADLVSAVVTERGVRRVDDTPAVATSLAGLARALYLRGWLDGTAGNLSRRLDGSDLALITASGRSKGELTAGDMVLIDALTGRARSPNSGKPSAETSIHAALYRTIPGCGAIVHAHSPYATAVSARIADAGGRLATFSGLEIIKGFGLDDPATVSVPVFPNWPDVPQIADDVAAHYTGRRAVPPVLLIAHHGATAWGPNLETARNRLECLEALCQLHVIINGNADHRSTTRGGPP